MPISGDPSVQKTYLKGIGTHGLWSVSRGLARGLENLGRRLAAYVARSEMLMPEGAKLLQEALIRGQFERGEASRITGRPVMRCAQGVERRRCRRAPCAGYPQRPGVIAIPNSQSGNVLSQLLFWDLASRVYQVLHCKACPYCSAACTRLRCEMRRLRRNFARPYC